MLNIIETTTEPGAMPQLRDEIRRRETYTAQTLAYFREHLGDWIGTTTLEHVGGRNAWRTRVSNARETFCEELGWEYPIPDNGRDPIRNRQRRDGDAIVSEYRYWPLEK